ncbi:hypothetical protein ACET3X_005355 [Alternaria dauci]|uniref:Lytic polysaccharide monooxygenase n=1 Tax=Alternaria dauci TaxID=48095 RepID=A0ABR3UK13_9PLEO
MSLRSTIMAAAAIFATANAHMIMKSPVPYSADKIDNAPITKSQFPCKSNLGFTVSEMNKMAVGEQQTIKFKGTAVHGGGSCQLSVTMDTEPTENSKFKVIKSIEGGCPGVDGTTSEYNYELPASIPNGKATFAWTWFSKMSGAPGDVHELPGDTVEKGATNDLEDPTAGGQPSASPSAPNDGQYSAAPTTPAAGQPSAAPTSVAGGKPSPLPSNGGGVFAPGASSAASVAPSAAPTVPGTSTTLVTVTASPTAPSPVAPTVPAGTGSPATPSTPSTPSAGGSSGTCTENGAVVCNGADQFGLCNNGEVVWQAVASGTQCTNGSITRRGYHGRIARPRRSNRRHVH